MVQSFFQRNLQFNRSFKKKLNEQLMKVGLYHSQWSIIYYLKQFDTTTLVEISNYLDVEKPTITRTVNRLEEQQLVVKIPSEDKRERRIQLTGKGLALYEEAKQIVDAFERSLLTGIPDDDQKKTVEVMQLLLEKLK
ncbi:MarR family winged helix-turn-helix transcriptional regulator [Oceanobacillus bengalensis]|uniref:MarR family transcriptional regulator n=1 Tax=Oceanobacillus bengalensis TaxID=1435466 RepID=A0A494Z3P1_9BACI|nr:MarR family transcriptional regulator [Oceanobacillus bengalensis]RKQ17145.1 MarR family transcriptional regulator [Oceanobacillus bengalensis]